MRTLKSLLPKRAKDLLKKVVRSRVIRRDGLLWFYRYNTDDGLAFGVHEAELEKSFAFRRGEVFFDVGAHAGRYAVRAARVGAVVFAWEPNPDSRSILLKNLRLNKLNATIFPEALSDFEGVLTLSNRGGRSRLGEEGEEVQVKTLDSYNFEKVDFIKIDTEGYESNVLRGALRTLRRTKPRLMIELHPMYVPNTEETCRDIIREAGYSKLEKLSIYGRSAYLSVEA